MSKYLLVLIGFVSVLALASASGRDVTFLATSDSHYREPDHRLGSHNDLNRASVEAMNSVTNLEWPTQLGGGRIAAPRGVVMLGDCIDDGDKKAGDRAISREQCSFFVADFGLDGSDGALKYPVFEGWGNHDGPPSGKEKSGFSFQENLKKRNLIRTGR